VTCQDIKKKSASKAHSQTVKCQGQQSRQQKKASKGGALTVCQAMEEGLITTANESQQAKETHSLSRKRGQQVRTAEESQRATNTHILLKAELVRIANKCQQERYTYALLSAEGVTSKVQEQTSEQEHSRSVEWRERVGSGKQKKASERRALTSCRARRDDHFKTAK
jgi:hypothetical protein